MGSVPVFYATSEGHTRQIAETIASTLREQGLESEAVELKAGAAPPDWSTISGAVVGASIHAGRHQPAAAAFVAREAAHLSAIPASFFSVSLAIASRNAPEVDAARGIAARLVQGAGWQPRRVACFAGKLAYTQYWFWIRWVMRRIAAHEGGPTDTSRDHVLTDWTAVRSFALAVAGDLRYHTDQRAAS
jgi:menaquinone-dependent protoporphyrinogen oxidase